MMQKLFNIWTGVLLLVLIVSWTIISIKFGNIKTYQVVISNMFIYIAYIIYLLRFYKYKRDQKEY